MQDPSDNRSELQDFGSVLEKFLHNMSKPHERCPVLKRFMTVVYIWLLGLIL